MSEKKTQRYSNEKITVRFDPNICEHAAKCVKGLPAVFNIKNRPWVNVDGATPDEIIDVVRSCPSGALTFELAGAVTVETALGVEITVVPNGPYRIAGQITLKDMEGNVLREMNKCSLCGCGASKKKPFCDGTHKSIDPQG